MIYQSWNLSTSLQVEHNNVFHQIWVKVRQSSFNVKEKYTVTPLDKHQHDQVGRERLRNPLILLYFCTNA